MKEKWQGLEKLIADKFKGKVVCGSGAPKFFGGDVETEEYLIECKCTDKKSRSLKIDEWNKIKKQALSRSKMPMYVIQIQNEIFIINHIDYFRI